MMRRVFHVISGNDPKYLPSRVFDCTIIILILVNVLLLILDTFSGFSEKTRLVFRGIETLSVIIFSVEYLLRIWVSRCMYPTLKPLSARIKYIASGMAIIDLLAILPFYLPLLIPIDLRVLRTVRLLRLLRILKVNRYTSALTTIGTVLKKKAPQLISAIFVVLILMIIASILMFNLEHEAQPEVFQNAFSGLWWATATFTTVGYGDIYPITAVGKLLSALISLLGIGLVAVPTGIISAGFVEVMESEKQQKRLKKYCSYCGEQID